MITNPDISLELIHKVHDKASRRTKVVCTLGPACWSVEGLIGLIDNGMNIARFNFSHGDHASHNSTYERLQAAIAARPGCHVGVMLDTKGPEIRTGVIDSSLGGKLKFVKNEIIEVGTDYSRPCTPQYLACSYKSLPKSVKIGSVILVADGAISLEVIEVLETSVKAKILNNATIGDRKNMNLPGAIVDLPTLTEKDIDDIKVWGIQHNIDYIAASFVRKASDVLFIREVLGAEAAKRVKIISKIENQEGLQNYDEILDVTDSIMVARGDLGMEIPIEKVFLAQKMMIHKANIRGVPVITATQMLESMITNPRPTRAECSDVANAVIDGSDAVMLSGETANGEYPNDAVSMLASIAQQAESTIDYDAQYENIRKLTLHKYGSISSYESIASSAVKISLDINADLIVVVTANGNTNRLISKYRPSAPIIAITSTESVANQIHGYLKNSIAKVVPHTSTSDESLAVALSFGKEKGFVKSGSLVVFVDGGEEGSTNFVKVITV